MVITKERIDFLEGSVRMGVLSKEEGAELVVACRQLLDSHNDSHCPECGCSLLSDHDLDCSHWGKPTSAELRYGVARAHNADLAANNVRLTKELAESSWHERALMQREADLGGENRRLEDRCVLLEGELKAVDAHLAIMYRRELEATKALAEANYNHVQQLSKLTDRVEKWEHMVIRCGGEA